MKRLTFAAALAALGLATSSLGQTAPRCFELRTYTVAPGKVEALHRRFQDHAVGLFEKHGIGVVAFWTPTDRTDTVMYMLAHPTCEAAPAAWKGFSEDPDWVAARTASEKDGPLVTKVEKVFLNPTAYSPLK